MARVPQKKKTHILANTMLLNVGGAGIVVLGIALAVRSELTPKPETPLCETRYQSGVLFSYRRKEGVPLGPEDLQARLAGTDRGLVANTRIVKDDAVPQGYAMEVRFKRSNPDEDDQQRSGVGYTWNPRQLSTAVSACLSYSIWLPEDFNFGTGGALPGLVSTPERVDYGLSHEDHAQKQPSSSGEASEQTPAPFEPFAARMVWRSDGQFDVLQLPNEGHRGTIGLDPAKASLKPAKWTRVEMEVILNEPGKPNGTIRAWIDGKLVDERFDVLWRRDEMQGLQAVAGSIHHTGSAGWMPSPADTRLRISPLELRLK
jgi:hypothetical protein